MSEPSLKKHKSQTDVVLSANRKSAQATRTLKACDTCRRLKVRCIKSDNSSVCARCSFLKKPCSLELDLDQTPSQSSDNSPSDLAKLDRIYHGVNELLRLVQSKPLKGPNLLANDAKLLLEAASSMKKNSTPGTPMAQFNMSHYGFPSPRVTAPTSQGNFDLDQPSENAEDDDDDMRLSFQSPANSFHPSPFSMIHSRLDISDFPRPILNLLNLSTVLKKKPSFYDHTDDIISLGILNELETIDLINDFRRNYGRWVSFPLNIPTGVLIERIRFKSSLLLTTCCCLSLRYSLNGDVNPGDIDNFNRKKKTYNQLMKQLVRDLDKSMLKYASFQGLKNSSGDIEFLQAMVILSIYSLSLSLIVSNISDSEDDFDLDELNLDPWFLSGIGLTTFITKSTFGSLFRNPNKKNKSSPLETTLSPFTILYDELDTDEYQTLTILRIYNHLTLVHLINCVFSGRMCVVDEIRLNFCTSTLSLPSSTNFDGRMVSEIGILLIAYNYIQLCLNAGVNRTMDDLEAGFSTVKDEIAVWYDQWEYLFSQPALQFVELCYDFCFVLIYYTYNVLKMSIERKLEHDDMFSTATVENIIRHCDRTSLVKLVEHSYHLVSFILRIENDSYFAYLSDQVHFCFYFCGIVYIIILKHLKDNFMLNILDLATKEDETLAIGKDNWLDSLRTLQALIGKYGRVGGKNNDDIITKYKNGLTELMAKSFDPDELIQL